MYIRIKRTPRSQSISVQLVESFRLDGKIKQRVIRHVGTVQTEEKVEELKQLAEALKIELMHEKLSQKTSNVIGYSGKFLGKTKEVSDKLFIHAASLEESQRYILGIHDIYGYIYDHLGFANPFYHPKRREFSAKILREIVLARIAYPTSKRSSIELLKERFGININLDNVYQMMNKIDDTFCEKIQKSALATALNLTGQKLRVLFYDATTLYFESFSEDALKQNGYSKDMKFNQAQVLLALFVTEKGLPVGYEVFPGATYEGHTLVTMLEKLKKRYQLDEVVFVADRGLLSEENLKYLEENKFKYIVGARIKNVSAKLKSKILNKDNYVIMQNDSDQKVAEFEYESNRYLIVNYSPERARKDAYDREKAVVKLRKKLAKSKDPKSLVNNYGYKKYISISGDATIEINKTRLENDAQWDGLAGIVTNIENITPEQALSHYRGLWQIEECFRIKKHDLKIRPIYHWTPQRVMAHIAINFMAFVCVRYLEYRLTMQSQKLSPAVIRDSLLQVQVSVIKDNKVGQHFLLPSKINSHAKEIYRVFRIKVPQKLMTLQM